jgi:hypothetical protein
MSKQFSWHREYYERALKQIATYAGKHTDNEEAEIAGWLEWFAEQYPEQHEKYQNAIVRINAFWDEMDPKAMEEFKKAVKVEIDATKWAIDKHTEWQKRKAEEEALKGTQESLV